MKQVSIRIAIFLAFGLAAIPRAHACLDLAGCQAALTGAPSPTFPFCCCDLYDQFTAPYASPEACLAANYFAGYGATPVTPPADCTSAGFDDCNAATCQNTTATTSVVFGTTQCACKAGTHWNGDSCVAGVATARTNCPVPGGIGGWQQHECSAKPSTCEPSDLPVGVPNGTVFDDLVNPMVACCGRGWGENAGAGSKLDCLEAVPPGPAGLSAGPPDLRWNTFYRFYMYDGSTGAGPASLRTAGLSHPNELFLVQNGVPLNGFYDQTGHRCKYRDSATKADLTSATYLTAQAQMDLIRNALTKRKLPAGPADLVDVDPYCCAVVTFALERTCPENNIVGGTQVAMSVTVGGVTYRRCTAAKQMRIHYGVIDLCDPNVVGRARFRTATSVQEVDPAQASIVTVDPIDIQNLISNFYPLALRDTRPACPMYPPGDPNSTVYEKPWTLGMCRLRATEPPYPYPDAP